MTHEEQRIWLINELLAEKEEYKNTVFPASEKEQKDLLRALFNVRMPAPASDEFIKIQDEYLQEESNRAKITSLDDLKPAGSDDRIYLWQGDITRLNVDAIVNAANSGMTGCYQPLHNCIDNCIHTFAGVELRNECNKKMEMLRKEHGGAYEHPTAVPMITEAYNLPAKKVIHIVGPVVAGELTNEHEKSLALCYASVLEIAAESGLKSLAFCCISTGVFMFPNERAAEIAVATVKAWLNETANDIKVIFNVFKDQDLNIYKNLLI